MLAACAQGAAGQERGRSHSDDQQAAGMPLREGVLTKNLGVPIVVVCCNCDTGDADPAASRQQRQIVLRNRKLSERQLEYVQRKLRSSCIEYGAALLYTSSTQGAKGASTLSDYMMHRLRHGRSSFPVPAQATDFTQSWIPSGWDSPGLIEYKGSEGTDRLAIDTPFDEAIPAPPKRQDVGPGGPGEGVTSYEDARFLERLLKKQSAEPGSKPSGGTRSSDAEHTSTRRAQETPARSETARAPRQQRGAQPKKAAPKDDEKQNPKLIKNFFGECHT